MISVSTNISCDGQIYLFHIHKSEHIFKMQKEMGHQVSFLYDSYPTAFLVYLLLNPLHTNEFCLLV